MTEVSGAPFQASVAGENKGKERAAVSFVDEPASKDQPPPLREPLHLDVVDVGTGRRTGTGSIDSDVPETIRIARASFCCSSCTLSDAGIHLVIDYLEVGLKREAGVAISYTWGEFERRQIVIGHGTLGADDPIYLELGKEWDITDLQKCLVDLSESHKGVWMDQLCIPQRQEEVTREMARIPDIYRNLDTIALMPGGVCGCLEAWTSMATDKHTTYKQAADAFFAGPKYCLNSLGLNSWFYRLWTWQELMYSKRISLRRTSQNTLNCVKKEEDVEHMERFGRLMYQQHRDKGFSSSRAFSSVITANVHFYENGLRLMSAYRVAGAIADGETLPCTCEGRCTCGNELYTVTFARFLRGDTIVNPRWRRDRLPPDNVKLMSFLLDLRTLGQLVRKATKLRDYVVAVWVDCPGYKIPESYKDMPFPDLLENAIFQLEGNFGVSPATNAPAALFGNREAGSLWRPTTYLRESDNLNTRTIYAVLSEALCVSLVGDTGPLVPRGHNSWPMTSRSVPSRHVFGGANEWKVFTQFKRVLDQFSPEASSRFLRSTDFKNPTWNAQLWTWNEDTFKSLLLIDKSALASMIQERKAGWNPKVDCHELAYEVVADALGLPFTACKRAGLELLMSFKDPPRVGLFKPVAKQSLGRRIRRPFEWARANVMRSHRYTTLCLNHQPSHVCETGDGCVLLEGEYIEVGSPARLDVVGIWVPLRKAPGGTSPAAK